MVQWVWEAAVRCARVDRVVVATDERRIWECARSFGADCVMTGECASGTDRVAEVVRSTSHPIVLNIQGDEPLLDPLWLDALIEPFGRDPSIEMTTLRAPIRDARELDDPNVVKVVVRPDSTALYFSRSRIPYPRERGAGAHKHIGLYGYRRDFLLRLAALKPSEIERVEALEQLRALEAGALIAVTEMDITSIAVDCPEDVSRIEAVLQSGRSAMIRH